MTNATLAEVAKRHIPDLKPMDRVLAYLKLQIPAEEKRAGNKLPTTREVSSLINVSPATVRNAYQVLVMQGEVETGVGSGSYWTRKAEIGHEKKEAVIGINVNAPPTDKMGGSWAYRIFGGILHAAFAGGQALRFKPVDIVRDGRLLTDRKELSRELIGLDGFILFPFHSNSELDVLLGQKAIPHVSLNPLSMGSTKRFVVPDYFQACLQVGRAFAQSGRKRVALFLAPGTDRSVACQMRLAGILSGLHDQPNAPDFRKVVSCSGARDISREVFDSFLDEGWIPDAVCAAGDDMAFAAMEAAEARGLRIPEDMSVVGGIGMGAGQPGVEPVLTSPIQPLEQIGEELVHMLQKVRQNPQGEIPGRIIPMRFVVGSTTLPEENTILRLSS